MKFTDRRKRHSEVTSKHGHTPTLEFAGSIKIEVSVQNGMSSRLARAARELNIPVHKTAAAISLSPSGFHVAVTLSRRRTVPDGEASKVTLVAAFEEAVRRATRRKIQSQKIKRERTASSRAGGMNGDSKTLTVKRAPAKGLARAATPPQNSLDDPGEHDKAAFLAGCDMGSIGRLPAPTLAAK